MGGAVLLLLFGESGEAPVLDSPGVCAKVYVTGSVKAVARTDGAIQAESKVTGAVLGTIEGKCN